MNCKQVSTPIRRAIIKCKREVDGLGETVSTV